MAYEKYFGNKLSGLAELIKKVFLNNPHTDLNIGHTIQSTDFNVVANAGSTQATGYQVKSVWTEIGTCASAGDALRLPLVKKTGMKFHIVNHGAQSADIFPPVGGNIQGAGADTANALAAAASRIYVLESYNASDGTTLWVTF